MLYQRIVEPGVPWKVQETTHLYELEIKEGAEIIAPEGKFLTLTVDGVGKPIVPGKYKGDIVMTVAELYSMTPHGLHLNFAMMAAHGGPIPEDLNTPVHAAAVVSNGKVMEKECVPAILQGGSFDGKEMDGVYVASSEEDFCGLVVDGDGKYTVKNSRFDLEGNGHDDWLGKGTAVSACDNVELEIDNCQFFYSGVTRCTVQASNNTKVVVKNSDFINIAPDGSDWVGSFSWQVGFMGHNRVTQLCDNADVRYENCRIHGNGWGLMSIDGTGDGKPRPDDPEWPKDLKDPGYGVTMYVKDSELTLTGPHSHGYGAFCIGDNHITFDHSKVDVYGYPILLMGMEGKGKFDCINGSKITGRRFGAFVIDDDNSVLNISDSEFDTGKSCICMKGNSTIVNIKNTAMKAGNGTILQLMDNDECGMNQADFTIPVGVKDVKDENRDLASVSATEDVTLNIEDCNIAGNFFNSTTNIRANKSRMISGMGKLHDTVLGVVPQPPVDAPSPMAMRHNGNDLDGAKNLGLNLKNTTITGVISSADQKYREGLGRITCENLMELSNVTQSAQPTVNNGVVVNLDGASEWKVTGTSYVTGLVLADGAKVTAADGKKLSVKVDGVETQLAAGTYTGTIELTVE